MRDGHFLFYIGYLDIYTHLCPNKDLTTECYSTYINKQLTNSCDREQIAKEFSAASRWFLTMMTS